MDEETVSDSLNTVFSGATLLLVGFVGGGVLTLGTKIVVARLFSADLYGVFSQGMSVMYMVVMVSMVGLNVGVSRFIAYHREDAPDKVVRAVPSALAAVVPVSILVFGLLFLTAGTVAGIAFGDPRMTTVLRVFALAGPFLAVNSILIAGFRGHQRSRERVILLDFVVPALQIVGVTGLVLLGFGILGATAGFAAAFALTTGIAAAWYRRTHEIVVDVSVLPELARFSWPLMVSSVAVQVFLWAPSIVVGMLATSRDVGLLNAALPLGTASKMFLSSVAFLFLPVTADLYSADQFAELRDVYAAATRWILIFSLPLMAFFLLYPARSVTFLFGSEYTAAGTALTLLMLGYLVNTVTGPVGDLLIAVGKTRHEMGANLFKLACFLLLAVVLVPGHGFVGGATAFATGMVIGNALRLGFCWEYVGFFYTPSFVKPFLAVGPALGGAAVLSGLPLPITAVLFGAAYAAGLVLLRPLEAVDRRLIEDAARDAGLELDGWIGRAVAFLGDDR